MYQVSATVTEHMAGFSIVVTADKFSGRRRVTIDETTWMVDAPFEGRERLLEHLEDFMGKQVSVLSDNLRRVASGESPVS